VNLRFCVVSAVMIGSLMSPGFVLARGASETQTVTLNEKVKIPGATLKPGDYTFSVEDRLQDRAIVRITAQDQSKHYLLLTVPSSKLNQPDNNGLIRFKASTGKEQVLHGWACPGCTPALEFVYPKAEAAKLTDQTTESVLAVDPASDKLPANLSADDMKVVTLWLLSPQEITASDKGKGVKAEKYASAAQPAAPVQTAAAETPAPAQTPTPAAVTTAEVAKPADTARVSSSTSDVTQVQVPVTAAAEPATPAPQATAAASSRTSSDHVTAATASGPTEIASAMPHHRLPKTASSSYLYLLSGLLLLCAAFTVRLSRRFSFSK